VNYDTTPPAVSLGTKVQGSKLTLTFSATDANSNSQYQCKIDSASDQGCSSGFQQANPTKGDHTAYVKATDGAGNPGTASLPFTIKSGRFKV
jgi:hypothetical protein